MIMRNQKKRKYNNESRLKKKLESDTKLFYWIVDFYALNNRMPTLVEQGKAFGYSKERARQLLNRLIERGWIILEREPLVKWKKVYKIKKL